MRDDQIRALDELEQAAKRLEAARKEEIEASQAHARAINQAHIKCPHLFSKFNKEEDFP